MPGPEDEYVARMHAEGRAFRARASEAYGRDGWARNVDPTGKSRERIVNELREALLRKRREQAGPESAFPPDMVRKAAVVGRSPLANVPVPADPFVGERHCRIVQVRHDGPLDRSVWVEPIEADRATRIRRGDGSPDTRVDGEPVRIFPGDTLIVGATEIPWTPKEDQ